MKHLYATLLVCLALSQPLSAITPFSLEGITQANVTILDKQKVLNEPLIASVTQTIETQLSQAGIHPSKKHFSNFLIKVQKIGTQSYRVSLVLVENARFQRATSIEGIAIGYSQDDFFESNEPHSDIPESIQYLVDAFLEQYREENPPSYK